MTSSQPGAAPPVAREMPPPRETVPSTLFWGGSAGAAPSPAPSRHTCLPKLRAAPVAGGEVAEMRRSAAIVGRRASAAVRGDRLRGGGPWSSVRSRASAAGSRTPQRPRASSFGAAHLHLKGTTCRMI